MLPFLPLIVGAATGAALTQLARNETVRKGIKRAGTSLRDAASHGLDNVRSTGARVRDTVSATLRRRKSGEAEGAEGHDTGAPALLLPPPAPAGKASRTARRSAAAGDGQAASTPDAGTTPAPGTRRTTRSTTRASRVTGAAPDVASSDAARPRAPRRNTLAEKAISKSKSNRAQQNKQQDA